MKKFVFIFSVVILFWGSVAVLAFSLAGCAYQAEMEMVTSLLPTLLNKEKRAAFDQYNQATKSARSYWKEGHFDKAIYDCEKALKFSKKIGSPMLEMGVFSLLGSFYSNMGEYKKGLEYAEHAYEQASRIGRKRQIGKMALIDTSAAMGNAYYFLGDFDKAEKFYKQALSLFEEVQKARKDRKYIDIKARVLNSIGLVYAQSGRYEDAEWYMSKSMSVAETNGFNNEKAVALSGLSYIYSKLGKFDEAVEHRQKAVSIFQQSEQPMRLAEALLHTAHMYLEHHRPDQAYPYLEQYMTMVREKGITSQIWEWELNRNFGRYHAQKNNLTKAASYYEKSIRVIESARSSLGQSAFKSGYLQNKLVAYDEYIQVLNALHQKHPKKGYDKKSLEIFERRQGRAFLEEMGKTGARQYAGLPEAVRQEELRLEKQISLLSAQLSAQREKAPENRELNVIRQIETELKTTESRLKKLERKIEENYPDYYALKYPKPVKIEILWEKLLQPGEAMLIYHVMEKETSLWTVDRNHFSLTTIKIGRDELTGKINIFRNHALHTGDETRGRVISLKKKEKTDIPDLHALLLPPEIRKQIRRAEDLYIVPTGSLYLMPFEALKNHEDRYLVENYSISYLSSASLLGILRESEARREKRVPYPLLAFANPIYGDMETVSAEPPGSTKKRSGILSDLRNEASRAAMNGNFIELPETEEEAREIQKILKAPLTSDPLQLRTDASRGNVLAFNTSGRLDQYRYLVFACHGVIPDTTSLIQQPALVLSCPDPVTKGDGFLTMSDVFGLKMNADLVTLSACNTGRGKAVPSEGVMGLTRAFMYAGTPAVTVTLWPVNSLAAKELNVGLFRKLKAGKGRAQALREIKLEMLKGKWAHPYYWAPVVMFGDGR